MQPSTLPIVLLIDLPNLATPRPSWTQLRKALISCIKTLERYGHRTSHRFVFGDITYIQSPEAYILKLVTRHRYTFVNCPHYYNTDLRKRVETVDERLIAFAKEQAALLTEPHLFIVASADYGFQSLAIFLEEHGHAFGRILPRNNEGTKSHRETETVFLLPHYGPAPEKTTKASRAPDPLPERIGTRAGMHFVRPPSAAEHEVMIEAVCERLRTLAFNDPKRSSVRIRAFLQHRFHLSTEHARHVINDAIKRGLVTIETRQGRNLLAIR